MRSSAQPNRSSASSSTGEWPRQSQHRVCGLPLLMVCFGNIIALLSAFLSSCEKCCGKRMNLMVLLWEVLGKPWHRLIWCLDLLKGLLASSCLAVLSPQGRSSPHQLSWACVPLGLQKLVESRQFSSLLRTSGIPSNWFCYLSFIWAALSSP